MRAGVRIARMGDRLFDRLRSRRAFGLDEQDAVDTGFDGLRERKYAVLVTFRRSGSPVPSPVWIGIDERGTLYVKTASHAGKVKRIRNESRVLVAASTARGAPVGPAIKATARLLPKEDWPHAEETLSAAYGAGRRLAERLLPGSDDTVAYIEISPRR